MLKTGRLVAHVDNDSVTLREVADELNSRGFEIISIAKTEQAVHEILARQCRVVLLDGVFTDGSGIELLKLLKEENASIQVILLTQDVITMSATLDSMRHGAEACFFKPLCNYTELSQVLDVCFEKIDRWWRTLYEWKQRKSTPATF